MAFAADPVIGQVKRRPQGAGYRCPERARHCWLLNLLHSPQIKPQEDMLVGLLASAAKMTMHIALGWEQMPLTGPPPAVKYLGLDVLYQLAIQRARAMVGNQGLYMALQPFHSGPQNSPLATPLFQTTPLADPTLQSVWFCLLSLNSHNI